MKMVSCKVMTIDNQKGNKWHKGTLETPRGCKGFWSIRRHWRHQGCRGYEGCIGGCRQCRHLEARRGIGSIRGN